MSRRSSIGWLGIRSRLSLSISRKLTRYNSWYSRTRPPPVRERMRFSRAAPCTCSTAWASAGLSASLVWVPVRIARPISAARAGLPPPSTYSDSNGRVVTPRSWKPQAAKRRRAVTAKSLRIVFPYQRPALNHDIDQPARHHHDFLRRFAFHEFLHVGVGQGQLLDRLLRGVLGHGDAAPELAVDLQHQLDLVLHQRGSVHLGPGRIEQVGPALKFRPQSLAGVRHDRREQLHCRLQRLLRHGASGGAVVAGLAERIHQLHHCG